MRAAPVAYHHTRTMSSSSELNQPFREMRIDSDYRRGQGPTEAAGADELATMVECAGISDNSSAGSSLKSGVGRGGDEDGRQTGGGSGGGRSLFATGSFHGELDRVRLQQEEQRMQQHEQERARHEQLAASQQQARHNQQLHQKELQEQQLKPDIGQGGMRVEVRAASCGCLVTNFIPF